MKLWKVIVLIGAGCALCLTYYPTTAQEKTPTAKETRAYTYVKDVAPIVKKYCLSCHGSDNENPSDLYMDDYAMMMKGGKHGVPVVAGDAEKSNLYLKLTADPPFGKQMPRGHKKITPEAVQVIHDWIEQGAKEK
jgi:uncharacterized membrane protein